MRRFSKIAAVARGGVDGAHRLWQARATAAAASSAADGRLQDRQGRRSQGRSRLRRGRPRRPVLQRLGVRRPGRRPSRTSTPPASRARPRTARPSPTARSACAPSPTQGFNPVIGVGFIYSPAAAKVAPSSPTPTSRSSTATAPTEDAQLKNVAYLDFAENEGSYLVGVAAALKTKAKHVGFVGGVAQRPDQEVRGRLHRRRASRSTRRSRSTSSTSPRTRTTSAGFENPAGGKAAADGRVRQGRRRGLPRRRQVRHRRLRRRRRGAGDGNGRSVSTPTSTSPRRRARSRTSSPRCSSASTSRSYDYDQVGRRRQVAAGLRHLRPEDRRRRLLHLRWLRRRHQGPDRRAADKIKSGEIKVPDGSVTS